MVTIVVSTKPSMPELLFHNIYRLVSREVQILLDHGFDVLTVFETVAANIPIGAPHRVRAVRLQEHRQKVFMSLVPRAFRSVGHFVIVLDADIVNMTIGCLHELVNTCAKHSCSVVAPTVTLEQAGTNRHPARWYDTAGFMHDGCRAVLYPPWFPPSAFPQPNGSAIVSNDGGAEYDTAIELNGSVGCVYCAAAELFENDNEGFMGDFPVLATEHWPLCQTARRKGGRILVRLDINATHAYLPKYGEEFH